LEDAAAVERGGVAEVEGSFDQADVLQAESERPGRFFEGGVSESDQLEDGASGDVRLPA